MAESHSWVIVTGSNCGIGFQTALQLAKAGVSVVLACRSEEKGLAAKHAIEREVVQLNDGSNAKVMFHKLDLSELQSVQQFAKDTVSRSDFHLKGLINNAGINYGGMTKDNLELRWQVNYLGHFLLTLLLLPKLQEYNAIHGEKARVVSLSSVMHRFGDTNWEKHATQLLGSSYSTSKLAMLMFANELNRRYGETITSVCVNPGFVNSDIWRNSSSFAKKFYDTVALTNSQGAACSVHAMMHDTVKGGDYYTPYWVPDVPVIGMLMESISPFMGATLTTTRPWTHENEPRERLWEVSKKLVSAYLG